MCACSAPAARLSFRSSTPRPQTRQSAPPTSCAITAAAATESAAAARATRECVACREQLRRCEAEIGARAAGVQARGLQLASQADFQLMKEGEIAKRKHYRALCWAARELEEADEQLLNGTSELVVQQDTPVRVLHRRAPLIRERV